MKNTIPTLIAIIFISGGNVMSQDIDLDWVQHYGSVNVSSAESLADMATDSAGNVYVTGRSNVSGVTNVVTIKYNPDGSEAWVAEYSGSAELRSHEIQDIAVDSEGSVYVGGTTWHSEEDDRYTLIKYSASGEQSWVVFYRGPGTFNRLTAIAIDSAGNILVTGRSEGTDSHGDYATVKYDSYGSEIWVARFNGLANDWDGAYGLAVDQDGNVYVTGESTGIGTGIDIATVKYDSSGTQLWAVRYNSPANGDDGADFLTVDDSGYVYVVGMRDRHSHNVHITIKYNSDGGEAWLISNAAYERDSKRSMAVDNAGNVYITGSSETANSTSGDDFLTIKYNPDGSMAWSNRYNGSGNNRDDPLGLAVDVNGNVYVVGYSQLVNFDNSVYTLIKYDSTGNQLWLRTPEGEYGYALCVTLDSQANIFIAGDIDRDYAMYKYTTDGQVIWNTRYEGTAYSIDLVTDMKMDNDGSVIVTGSSANSFFGFDLDNDVSTIKYNQDGNVAWIAKYDSPYQDLASSLVVDETGNIYVSGRSLVESGDTHSSEAVTIKYTPAGEELWVALHPGCRPANLAVDNFGNVYITGDTITVKYNSDGTEAWVAPHENFQVMHLETDINGNVYLSGNAYQDGIYVQASIKTVKYSPDGDEIWISQYSGSANLTDYSKALAVDSYGNVFVAGSSRTDCTDEGGSDFDWVTIKYDTDGNEVWTNNYNSPGDQDDYVSDLVIDATGNIYVAGSVGSECAIIKYNPNGSEAWVNNYFSAMGDRSYIRDLKVDGARNVYACLEHRLPGGEYQQYSEFITLKYNSDGSEAWVIDYGAELQQANKPISLAIDYNGDVYIAGTSGAYWAGMYFSGWDWATYTTIKYNQPNYPVSTTKESIPETFCLAQNFPNPFNPTTTISYDLPEASIVRLTVFDMLGHEVMQLENTSKSPGKYEVQWNGIDHAGNPISTGVYLCRLEAGAYTKTIKMLYLR